MTYIEDKLSLNNMERLTACAVKTVEADDKYEAEDVIILGPIGKDALLTRVFAIVTENFQAGARLEFGSTDAKYSALNAWNNFPLDDTVAGDIVHLDIPTEDNANGDGTAYTGDSPASYALKAFFYAKFRDVAPGDTGTVRIVFEYAYIKSNQTGGYLA